jgi:hypothetical protein
MTVSGHHAGAEKLSVGASDRESKRLYLAGGVAALALGFGYLATIPIYAYVGSGPTAGDAWLRYLTGKATGWWMILGLSVATDLLYVPAALALYEALKTAGRNLMLVATAFVGLFIVLDLAVTWSSYASLLTLAGSYRSATSDLQRAALAAAANYPASVLASPLERLYAISLLSFAILLIGVVMLRGVFSKAASYLAIGIGVLGLASMAGWSVTILANALAATLWVLLVGYRLVRLGSKPRDADG